MADRRTLPGIHANIIGKAHEIRVPERGPRILCVQVTHGKDKKTGNFKPSSFIDVKVFDSRGDMMDRQNPKKGDLLDIKAWAATDEWTSKDGQKMRKLVWTLDSFEVVERYLDRQARRDPAGDITVDEDDIPF